MRLTHKKAQAWQSRIERAKQTIANVEAEVSAQRLRAKGGDLTELTVLLADLRAARAHVQAADTTATALAEREERKASRG